MSNFNSIYPNMRTVEVTPTDNTRYNTLSKMSNFGTNVRESASRWKKFVNSKLVHSIKSDYYIYKANNYDTMVLLCTVLSAVLLIIINIYFYFTFNKNVELKYVPAKKCDGFLNGEKQKKLEDANEWYGLYKKVNIGLTGAIAIFTVIHYSILYRINSFDSNDQEILKNMAENKKGPRLPFHQILNKSLSTFALK